MFSKPEDIKFAAREFFAGLFNWPATFQYSLLGISFQTLLLEQSGLLTALFSNVEIFEGLRNYRSTKSSGPDGFNFLFYKRAWPILKEDIIRVFTDFFYYRRLPKV